MVYQLLSWELLAFLITGFDLWLHKLTKSLLLV